MKESDQYLFANSLSAVLNSLINEVRRNSGYLARKEIERLTNQIKNDPKRLEQYGFKVYSQNDEDGIIQEIFERLGIKKGVFCEIGIQNGLECNTLYLIHKGWKGCWLEGDQSQAEPIRHKFKAILENKRLVLGVAFITPSNINEILDQNLSSLDEIVADIDFLSIDIDGMDIYLLEALSFNPKVICIEYNAKFPASLVKKIVPNEKFIWDGSDYFGASLRAINEIASLKGYSLVGTNITGANAFFVRNDLLDNKFANTERFEMLYNPPRYYLTTDQYQNNIGHESNFGDYVDLS